MTRTLAGIAVAFMLVLTVAAVLQAVAQPGAQFGAFDGGMGGPPMGPPPGGGSAPAVVAYDGEIYVAYEGTLTAFEAKTLEQVAQATYWERPEPPAQ